MFIKTSYLKKFCGSIEKIVIDIVDYARANPTYVINSFHINEACFQYEAELEFSTPAKRLDLDTMEYLYNDIKRMVFVENPASTLKELELRDNFEQVRSAILARLERHIERAKTTCD